MEQPVDYAAAIAKLPPAVQDEIRRQARAECWRRGELSYKLKPVQRKIRAALLESKRRKFFLLCSRRLGKTFTLICHAFEVALRKPHAQILYLAPLANMATEIVTSGLRVILEHCPSNIQIEVKPHIKEIHFSNGSIIRLKGVNSEQADNLRGGAQDLVILDECGMMDRLDYVLSSVVMPMTMTIPTAKVILATTPAVTPGHDSTNIYLDLNSTGDACKFTLIDSDEELAPYETKVEYLKEAREDPADIPDILSGKCLPKGTTALREYWCEFVVDSNRAVVPEFRLAKPNIVKKAQRDELFDAYVGVDPGQVDKTALVFCTYNFKQGVIIVEDEALLHRASTNDVATVVLDKEWALWGNQKPLLRVVDDDLRMIADLRERHGLAFVPAIKPNATAAMNLLRTMIQNHELIIDPKCVLLIQHLEHAVWNNKGTQMARIGDGGEESHHFDLVDALKYTVRAVNRMRNPYPAGYRSPGMQTDGRFRSPKSRFWTGGIKKDLDLLGNTPVAKRLKRRKK